MMKVYESFLANSCSPTQSHLLTLTTRQSAPHQSKYTAMDACDGEMPTNRVLPLCYARPERNTPETRETIQQDLVKWRKQFEETRHGDDGRDPSASYGAFLTLPLEIRRLIWAELLKFDPLSDWEMARRKKKTDQKTEVRKSRLAIMQTSKCLQEEVAQEWNLRFGKSIVTIDVAKWRGSTITIPGVTQPDIRIDHLTIDQFSGMPWDVFSAIKISIDYTSLGPLTIIEYNRFVTAIARLFKTRQNRNFKIHISLPKIHESYALCLYCSQRERSRGECVYRYLHTVLDPFRGIDTPSPVEVSVTSMEFEDGKWKMVDLDWLQHFGESREDGEASGGMWWNIAEEKRLQAACIGFDPGTCHKWRSVHLHRQPHLRFAIACEKDRRLGKMLAGRMRARRSSDAGYPLNGWMDSLGWGVRFGKKK